MRPSGDRTLRARRSLLWLGVGFLVAWLTACSGIPGLYVVEQPGAAGGGPAKFDAEQYVDGIWESKVIPTVRAESVPAATLLPALASDQAAASKKYGKQAGSGSPYSFLIKGSGVVSEVDDNGAVGTIALKVPGVSDTDVRVAIGPAFVGTAIRDAVGFIDFSQFTNQLDYADVATALNSKVKTTVVDRLDPKKLKGKKVTFEGAFQLVVPSTATITPAVFQVAS